MPVSKCERHSHAQSNVASSSIVLLGMWPNWEPLQADTFIAISSPNDPTDVRRC